MKKFTKNIILFFLLMLVTGELTVRFTHAVSDIPQRTIDEFGIQKYKPNQRGFWKGGDHTWVVNEFGWPGILPKSYDNLVMVIGDSFIENFMNSNECHQSEYLKNMLPEYNFMETGRSGISLIEAMEISKQLDTLKPKQHLIYVNDHDFYESIVEVKPMADITQLSLKDSKIVYGEMKAPELKKVLYNWKLLYYFYNRFPISGSANEELEATQKETETIQKTQYTKEIIKLLNYIKSNYKLTDKTLVFHPNSNKTIISLSEEAGFKTILLDSKNDKTWTFDYDSHWTCYGHERAAEQISIQIPF
ncbi:hypothetical protein [Winogradskyella sp.]